MSMLMTVIDGARPKRILMLTPILISWPSWAVDVMLRKLMVPLLIQLLVMMPLWLWGKKWGFFINAFLDNDDGLNDYGENVLWLFHFPATLIRGKFADGERGDL